MLYMIRVRETVWINHIIKVIRESSSLLQKPSYCLSIIQVLTHTILKSLSYRKCLYIWFPFGFLLYLIEPSIDCTVAYQSIRQHKKIVALDAWILKVWVTDTNRADNRDLLSHLSSSSSLHWYFTLAFYFIFIKLVLPRVKGQLHEILKEK